MSTQTATETTQYKDEGVRRFGILRDIEQITTRKGDPYVRGKLEARKKDGTVVFTQVFTCFKIEAVQAILAMGNGADVYMFGFMDTQDVDGKFTRKTFRPIIARPNTPNTAAQAPADTAVAPVADAKPAAKAAPAKSSIDTKIPF